tara:strand:+ start:1661 stop:1921 length:261 start_codon:yes stop_codon:yes gene_type:complete
MAYKKPQKSLKQWTKEDWGTSSGKKSSETGERYLPKAARDSLTPAQKAAGNKKKREAAAKGKQRASYTKAERLAFLKATNRKRKMS